MSGPDDYIRGIEDRPERDLGRVREVSNRSKRTVSAIDLRDPLSAARAYCLQNMAGQHCTVRYSKGQFFTWNGSTYGELSEDYLRERTYAYLAGETDPARSQRLCGRTQGRKHTSDNRRHAGSTARLVPIHPP